MPIRLWKRHGTRRKASDTLEFMSNHARGHTHDVPFEGQDLDTCPAEKVTIPVSKHQPHVVSPVVSQHQTQDRQDAKTRCASSAWMSWP